MSEMVERVAKAIVEVNGNTEGLTFSELSRAMARAAIESMREPSEAMLAAFNDHCDEGGCCLVKTGYRAMIDAALPKEVKTDG